MSISSIGLPRSWGQEIYQTIWIGRFDLYMNWTQRGFTIREAHLADGCHLLVKHESNYITLPPLA
jgi:hypothetical protein